MKILGFEFSTIRRYCFPLPSHLFNMKKFFSIHIYYLQGGKQYLFRLATEAIYISCIHDVS